MTMRVPVGPPIDEDMFLGPRDDDDPCGVLFPDFDDPTGLLPRDVFGVLISKIRE
jgi:hypothetical protein